MCRSNKLGVVIVQLLVSLQESQRLILFAPIDGVRTADFSMHKLGGVLHDLLADRGSAWFCFERQSNREGRPHPYL